MRKLLLALVFLAAAASARAAEDCSQTDALPQGKLPACLAIDGVTTTTTSSTINSFGHRILGAQIWSAAGSVATVDVNCRSYASSTVTPPWYPCYSTTNPSAAGVYVSLPRAYQYQVVVTWTSGTVYATFERYNN